MATIKLKKPSTAAPPARRPPVRGSGSAPRPRPTLAQAQAQRAEEAAAKVQAGGLPEHGRGTAAPAAGRSSTLAEGRASATAAGRASAAGRPPIAGLAPKPPVRPATPIQGSDRRAATPPPPRRGPPVPPPRPTPVAAPRPKRAPFDHRPARPVHDDDDDDASAGLAFPDHAPGSVRLSKRMSELGLASRREADEWIAKGWVRVDDQVVAELGSRVLPGQRVTVDAKARFQQGQRVTVLVHKPIGYVSGQAEDGYEPALVLVTPQNHWQGDASGIRFLPQHLKSLVPAGRLDIDSVGLLVLTQDGRIAKQLIGEDSDIEKEYLVRVGAADGGPPRLADADLARLRHGLALDGEALRPATVEWLNADQLRFVLRQGKKRQIRRMCEAVGLRVLGLKRVRIGRVLLGELPPGQWRYLGVAESF